MYNLYIVDDDPTITNGLRINIPWEKHGISVAGTAPNGLKALDLMKLLSPDIVISDVKMPQMDGIELAYNIQHKFPKARILLLSAHDEFSYVRDALRLHVVDYLLKPVDSCTILETVTKIATNIENERRMECSLREHLPTMRKLFLSRIASRYYKDEYALRSQIEFLELPIIPGNFISAKIKFDDINFYGGKAAEQELLKFSVSNITEELVVGELKPVVFDSGEDTLGLIFCAGCIAKHEIPLLIQSVTEYLGKILEMVETHIKTTVTISFGNCYEGLSGIHRSYIEACSAIRYSHITGTNNIYSPYDANNSFESSLIEYEGFIEKLISKVHICVADEAFIIIDTLSAEIKKRPSTSIEYLNMLCTEIVITLIRDANRSYGGNPKFKKLNLFNYYNQVNNSSTLDKMVRYLKELVATLCAIGSAEKVTSKSKLVSQAVEYIMDNYSDDTISLNKVARAINVTPVYLCILFKKEKGVNFMNFLLSIRMNKAIDLIRLHDLKFYEVAEMVGYKNPDYFGMCFKKFTGYSPSQLWKRGGGNGPDY